MKISIVIPAYNEEKRIRSTVNAYASFMETQYPDSHEILVVCDGCTDSTPDIVRSMQNDFIKLVERPEKLGKGGGIKLGFAEASGDIMGFVDADNAVTPENFNRLIEGVDGADMVIASRRERGAIITVKQPLTRRLVSRIFNLILRIFFGLPFKDTQCGGKLMTRAVVDAIMGKVSSNGFEFDVELLLRAKKAGCRIKEVPISWEHKEGATFNFKHIPGMFLKLIEIRFQRWA